MLDQYLIWILVIVVVILLIWVWKLHTTVASLGTGGGTSPCCKQLQGELDLLSDKVDDCCKKADEAWNGVDALTKWAIELKAVLVEMFIKCCPGASDPNWPPSDPPAFPPAA
jgi:hypothetical protein